VRRLEMAFRAAAVAAKNPYRLLQGQLERRLVDAGSLEVHRDFSLRSKMTTESRATSPTPPPCGTKAVPAASDIQAASSCE